MTQLVENYTYRGETYQMPVCPQRYVRVNSLEDLLWLEGALKDKGIDYVAFDTETTGLGRDAVAFGMSLTWGRNGKPEKTCWIRWIEGEPPVREKKTLKRKKVWVYHEDEKLTDVWFNHPEKYKTLLRIVRFLFQDNSAPRVIMHNGAYDIRIVRQTFNVQWVRDMEPKCPFNDTMIMHNVLRRGLIRIDSSSLKELGAKYLNHKDRWDWIVHQWFDNLGYPKRSKKPEDRKNYAWIPEKIMLPYAAADSELTYKLFFVLSQEFTKYNAPMQYIYKLERTVVPIVADIAYKGQYIDKGYFEFLREYMSKRQAELLADLQATFADDLNPNSSPQMQAVLYGKYNPETKQYEGGLGLPIIKRTDTGAPSCDSETLEKLSERFDIPELQLVALHNRYKSVKTNFVDKFLDTAFIEPDGHTIRTDLQQIVETGRFSSRNPNLQNIPNDARRKFANEMPDGSDISIRRGVITPPGFLLVKADYAQFELRVLANACLDPKFCSMILDGIDMHSWLAVGVYREELAQLKKENAGFVEQFEGRTDPLTKKYKLPWQYWAITSKANDRLKYMRNMVKLCSFAIVYGAGAAKISREVGVLESEAEALRSVYFNSFPALADWSYKTRMIAMRSRRIETLFGRQRVIPPPSKKAVADAKKEGKYPKDAMYTASVNTIIQGTSADLLKHAMYFIHKMLRGHKSYMSATIHDEVHVYMHHTEFELINDMVRAMESRYLPEKYPIPMIAEVSAGATNWADCTGLDHSIALVPQLQGIWSAAQADNN